ncbi:MAG: hypothetical protein ACM3ZE_22295 [Myxococcales bacterium]
MHRKRALLRLVMVACWFAAATAGQGCRKHENNECKAFVQAVNLHLAEIERVTDQDAGNQAPTPTTMRRLASLYRDLAAKIGALSMHSSELRQLSEQYRAMVLDAAKLAGSIADSIEAKDISAAMKTHQQFSEVVSREDALVGSVNALCRTTQ